MDRIARASTDERRLVFEAAAQRMALAPAVVEKDFWVCYTLDHLFHRSGFAESMVFKGGTSLSKAFGLIERFSEDIDLILDWRLLGYGENEPWEPRSNSAQERFKADSIERTNVFLADAFAPKLRATLSESLGTEASVRCGAEEETVYFDYPRSYESAGTLDTIKLEIGPMAAWSPSEEAAITPYAADVVPFGPELSTTVRTASPERTFWEKATILHQEANRPEGKAMPRRYSRHYYDMYRLGHSFVLGRAVAQPGLLEHTLGIALHKEPAMVAEHLRLYDIHAVNGGLDKFHSSALNRCTCPRPHVSDAGRRGTYRRYWPPAATAPG